MKKLIFSFVILFAAMTASVNAQSVVTIPVSKINEVYQQVLKLNANRFANVNQIQIGDTVLLPSLVGGGTEFMIASEPSGNKHDCLYRISTRYLFCELKTQPVEKAQVNPILLPTPSPKFIDYNYWTGLGVMALILLVILFYMLHNLRSDLSKNRRNINRRPVVSGGLSNNPAEAAAQISALTGTRIVKSEKGRLICATSVKVKMHFSDGVKKVPLVSGEEYYRVTEDNGTVRYARRPCGNLINGSISELPAGVTFVLSTEENSTWVAPSLEEKQPELEVKPEPEIEEELPLEVTVNVIKDSILTGKDITMILEAAGKMTNAPSFIAVGDLTIEFPTKKEE